MNRPQDVQQAMQQVLADIRAEDVNGTSLVPIAVVTDAHSAQREPLLPSDDIKHIFDCPHIVKNMRNAVSSHYLWIDDTLVSTRMLLQCQTVISRATLIPTDRMDHGQLKKLLVQAEQLQPQQIDSRLHPDPIQFGKPTTFSSLACCCVCPEGTVVIDKMDLQILRWGRHSVERACTFSCTPVHVSSAGPRRLVVTFRYGGLQVLDLKRSAKTVRTDVQLAGNRMLIRSTAFTAGGDRGAVIALDGSCHLCRLAGGVLEANQRYTMEIGAMLCGSARGVSVHSCDSGIVINVAVDAGLRVFRLVTDQLDGRPASEDAILQPGLEHTAKTFVATRSVLYQVSDRRLVHVWAAPEGERIQSIHAHGRSIFVCMERR